MVTAVAWVTVLSQLWSPAQNFRMPWVWPKIKKNKVTLSTKIYISQSSPEEQSQQDGWMYSKIHRERNNYRNRLLGLWSVTSSMIYSLWAGEQESQWCNSVQVWSTEIHGSDGKSHSVSKSMRPGALTSEGRRRWMSQLKQRE